MGRWLTEPKISAPVVGLLVLLAVLPYVNALTAGFTLDDEVVIRTNPAVTEGLDPLRIFASPLTPGDLYRPCTVLTFALNEASSPGVALPFHAVNIGLHAIVTLLVLLLALRLFESPLLAIVATMLFAIHPIHTEAVTSLVGRAELLTALFGLVALLGATGADSATPRVSQVAWRAVSLAAFSLAILSKESGITLLPLIVLLRSARRGPTLGRGIISELRHLDWVPYALCGAVLLTLRLYVVGSTGASRVVPIDNVLAFVPWMVRIRSALAVLWDYFALLNLPLILAADYSYNAVPVVTTWFDARCLAGALLVVLAVMAATRARRPAIAFAAAFPFVALSLTANLLLPIGTVKAERLLYLPSVGWALLVAYAFDRLRRVSRYRPAAVCALAVVCVGFVARTWVRNWDWQDNISLARSMAASAPQSAKSRNNFGVALLKQGRAAAAQKQFLRALAIYEFDESAFGMGIAFKQQNAPDEAIRWFRKALEINPGLGKAHTDLCHLLWLRGEFEAAARACRSGLRYNAADPNLLKGLGSSFVGQGEMEKGRDILHRALALNPEDDELRTYLASLDTVVARQGSGREGVR